MARIQYEDQFDFFERDERSRVFQVFPDVFGDERGSFCEVAKAFFSKADLVRHPDFPRWMYELSWIEQINRSRSAPGTVRGCHAQKGTFCQGKLVQSVSGTIYDVITDARPDSRTFGSTCAYRLDPSAQNQLWVPRGFLHAFVFPGNDSDAGVFEYFCDNVYDKASETGVNPMTLLPKVVGSLSGAEYSALRDVFAFEGGLKLSDKDLSAPNYEEWMEKTREEYGRTRKAWYK